MLLGLFPEDRSPAMVTHLLFLGKLENKVETEKVAEASPSSRLLGDPPDLRRWNYCLRLAGQ